MTEEKTKGVKRHIVIDTMGNILAVNVHKANQHDKKDGIFVFEKLWFLYTSIKSCCADEGYNGEKNMLLVILYAFLGYRSVSYLKYHLLHIEAVYTFDTFNYFMKTLITGLFFGWLTVPVMAIHWLLIGRNA